MVGFSSVFIVGLVEEERDPIDPVGYSLFLMLSLDFLNSVFLFFSGLIVTFFNCSLVWSEAGVRGRQLGLE